ncbi:ATP-binding protein [Turicibacter sp. KK003]|uniref:sensor histidine kinase n=1 Tax=Turicibacter sp. KK003 TaxID=3114695 RepID=UPI0030D5212C
MKKLFWRITMTFWVLFGIVVVSFTLTFYWNYEKIYSQKLLEIDRDVNKIGTQIDRNIVSYERLLKTEEYKLLTLTEDNLRVLESLNDEARHQLMKDGGFVESDDLFESAYLSAINSMNDILQKNRELYVDDHRVLDFQIVPIFDQGYSDVMSNNYPEGTETIKVGDALYLVNDKFADKRNWTIYKLIESQGILFGYIKLSVVSIGPGTYGINSDQIVEMIYYIGNNQYIDEELPTKLSSRIKESNFEEASQLLKDNGYYTNRYISSKNNIKMIYYVANKDLRKAILRETISLFEFSTILLTLLFFFAAYTLFIVIIKLCYLLIEYVERCGNGDYSMPPRINPAWKTSFLMVRNAYLENERLLKVKDNQSQELELAWQRSLLASQAKTLFLAKVSHELKTPLNAIKGYVQLLKLSIEQPKQRKQLEIIEHSSDILLKHVNELLDFSMIEDGKVKLTVTQINVFHMVDTIKELFFVETANKGIKFIVNTDSTIPTELYGDEGRIKQIIINLVSNAIKFTEQGEIRIDLTLDYQNESDAYLSIKVTDTGKGIAPDKLESIFEAFTQENNTISRRFGGTGLGLSISKRLAEAMGGRLTVESTVDIGSTFTLFLPLSKSLVEEQDI